MSSQSSHPNRTPTEFTGGIGLIRRFVEEGTVIEAKINDQPMFLSAENYVKVDEDSVSIEALFKMFKKIQRARPDIAPFTAIQTIDNPTPDDYAAGNYHGEWCIYLLGESDIDIYDENNVGEDH